MTYTTAASERGVLFVAYALMAWHATERVRHQIGPGMKVKN